MREGVRDWDAVLEGVMDMEGVGGADAVVVGLVLVV